MSLRHPGFDGSPPNLTIFVLLSGQGYEGFGRWVCGYFSTLLRGRGRAQGSCGGLAIMVRIRVRRTLRAGRFWVKR